MENEALKEVLTELMEGQKEIAQAQTETILAIQQLDSRMEQAIGDLKNTQARKPTVDLEGLQMSTEKCIADIKFLVDMVKQKAATDNMRIFLQSDAKKWAVYLLVAFMFLTYLYWFAMRKYQ